MSHPIKFVLLSLTGVVLCAQHNRTIITKSEHHKSHRLTRPPKAADLAPPPRPLLTKGADIIFSGRVAGSLGQIYWSTHQFIYCGKLSAYHGDRVTTIVLYNTDTGAHGPLHHRKRRIYCGKRHLIIILRRALLCLIGGLHPGTGTQRLLLHEGRDGSSGLVQVPAAR